MDFDVDRLVDMVTKEIIKELGGSEKDSVLVTAGCPEDAVSENYNAVRGSDPCCCKYVLLTADAYKSLMGECEAQCCANSEPSCGSSDGSVDLRGKRLLHERDLRDHKVQRGTVVRVSKKTIITALAHDYAKGLGARIVREN